MRWIFGKKFIDKNVKYPIGFSEFKNRGTMWNNDLERWIGKVNEILGEEGDRYGAKIILFSIGVFSLLSPPNCLLNPAKLPFKYALTTDNAEYQTSGLR